MYGCESCIIKKAEHWRIDAFELWCWRRLLRVPLTLRRCIQSTLKEISPGCSLEGLMLKLKFQYFGHLMQGADSLKWLWCWERLKAGWDGWTASPTQWTLVRVNTESWWGTVSPGMLQSMGLQRVRHEWATERNWTAPTLFRVDRCFPSPPHQGFFKEYSLSFFLLYALFAFISF